jgi:hypothetical protein
MGLIGTSKRGARKAPIKPAEGSGFQNSLFPRLKSCGFIEGGKNAVAGGTFHRFPRLKSCGFIEGSIRAVP